MPAQPDPVLARVLNDPRLRGRLLFGTDHPLTNTPLVTPLQYPLRLTPAQMWDLLRTRNPWDRSVKLKAALGVPPEDFLRARDYLLGPKPSTADASPGA